MAHKKRKNKHDIAAALDHYCKVNRATNEQIAKAIGMSEGGVRLCRQMGRPPKNALARKALMKLLGMRPAPASVPMAQAPCPRPRHPSRQSAHVMSQYVDRALGRTR